MAIGQGIKAGLDCIEHGYFLDDPTIELMVERGTYAVPAPLNTASLAPHRDAFSAAALDDIGLLDFETLRGWYTAGPEEMRAFVGPGLVLTDDRPLLEYHRSLPGDREDLDLRALRGDFTRVTQ